MIVGACLSDIAGSDRGAAFVFHGSPIGVNTAADKTLLYTFTDNTTRYGYAVAFIDNFLNLDRFYIF